MAVNKIVIGLDRLPTLEVLGVEYPYDITSQTALDKLEEIANSVDVVSMDKVVDLYKQFIKLTFCNNQKVVDEIEKVYGDSLQLWADAAIQVAGYIQNPKYSTIIDRVSALKQAADEK
jgi:hypothetical protein